MTAPAATITTPAIGPTTPATRVVRVFDDTLAIVGRNLLRIGRAPDQMMFTLFAPVMFTLLFRYVFSGAIAGMHGVNYVNYLIPGVAAQTAMFASGNSGFGLAEDRQKGFTDRLRSLPMSRTAVITGRVICDAIANSAGLLIIVLVGVAVGFRPHSILGLILGLAVLLAFTMATSFMFALVGQYASNAQAVNAITFPLIMPLTFASSAFVSPATMPSWLRAFANHQPVSVVIFAVRDLSLGNVTPAQRQFLFAGQSTTSLVIQSLMWAAVLGAIFCFLAVRKFNSTAS